MRVSVDDINITGDIEADIRKLRDELIKTRTELFVILSVLEGDRINLSRGNISSLKAGEIDANRINLSRGNISSLKAGEIDANSADIDNISTLGIEMGKASITLSGNVLKINAEGGVYINGEAVV